MRSESCSRGRWGDTAPGGQTVVGIDARSATSSATFRGKLHGGNHFANLLWAFHLRKHDAGYSRIEQRADVAVVRGPQPHHRVRTKLDARCTPIDDTTGREEEFVLLASCRSEWMYRDDTLFQEDSKEFREIWSATEPFSFGYGLAQSDRHDTPTILAERFIDSGIEDHASGLRVVLEYPIHTMNFLTSRRFQVDTGPLLFPDFSRETDRWISLFAVAHACYHTFDREVFILRRPTPVIRDGVSVCEAMHYSDIRRMPARNRLLEVGA